MNVHEGPFGCYHFGRDLCAPPTEVVHIKMHLHSHFETNPPPANKSIRVAGGAILRRVGRVERLFHHLVLEHVASDTLNAQNGRMFVCLDGIQRDTK